MLPLTENENQSHRKQKLCYIWRDKFNKNNEKKYRKIWDRCHSTGKDRGVAHLKCNLRYKNINEIPAVFHSGSTSDYNLIIKKLAAGSEGQFECLRENTDKYITLSVPIEKGLTNGKKFLDQIKFIDSIMLMVISLSNLADNLTEGKFTNCESQR